MGDPVVVRAQLYPRSGVGVAAPWLVVAPPGNPVIRLDLRLLDRVAVCDGDDDDDDSAPDAEPRSHLMLVCGDLDTCLYIIDGPDAVEAIVRDAWPLTREGAAAARPASTSQAQSKPSDAEILIVGDDAVRLRGDYIQVGGVAFRVNEVREYALQGANLPLPEGRLLQAALAMFVVAAAEREAECVFRAEDFWTARSGSGDALPIVWLHGGPGLWDYLAPAAALTDALCVSYRYDQRGCGRTRARGGYSVAQSVADLEALRAHWGAERFILAGHGWGASLALHYSLAHPERVAGRLLIGTCGLVPGSRHAASEELRQRLGPEREAHLDALAERLEADDTLENERAFLEMMWASDCVEQAAVRTLFVDALRINGNVHSSLGDADRHCAEAPGFLERLSTQEIPTLVVHGELDTRPAAAARELAALLPAADVLLVPSAGHYPWLEAPDVVRAGLHDFLRRVGGRASGC